MDHLKELNQAQKEAVLHKNGPLLVLAGAGAGKTKVITLRIYELIKSGISPGEILAITFTNKAAKEMRERVFSLLGKRASGYQNYLDDRPFVSTFHSLGVSILKENHEKIGLNKHFSVFDKEDSGKLMKEAIKEVNLDPKKWSPGKIAGYVSKLKGDLVGLNEYEEIFERDFFTNTVSKIWRRYEELKKKEKGLDFGDLLLKTARLLEKDEKIREHYQNKWKHIHVDEYQDTNKVQYAIVNLLSLKHKNVFAVGDVDQNIYSWRGANIRNILNFEKDFGNPRIVTLEENYRSTKRILDASNLVIAKNKNRYDKKLFTQKDGGEKLGLSVGLNEHDEGAFIAGKSKELIQKGTDPNEIAVLYRANFQSRVLEEAFLARDIPYQVLGTRFFERKEVKDVLSYLRAALNPESLSDLKRIVNVPPRGIGKATLLKIFSGKISELPASTKVKVESFYKLLKEIREIALSQKTSETIKFILRKSDLEKKLKDGTDEDLERLENIKELVTLGKKYDELNPEEGVEKLLEDSALYTDQDGLDHKTHKTKSGVKLMTVHAAKGLEFEYVFIAGLEEGLFPHEPLEIDEEHDDEEERRLFYVALTRAKKKVFLTYAETRTIYGRERINLPSEFLNDLDESLLEEVGLGENVIQVD